MGEKRKKANCRISDIERGADGERACPPPIRHRNRNRIGKGPPTPSRPPPLEWGHREETESRHLNTVKIGFTKHAVQ